MSQPRTLFEKFKDRIRETQQASLILPRHMHMMINALDNNNFVFRVPQRITARIESTQDADYGFSILRCSQCGRLYHYQQAVQNRMRCSSCNSRPHLSQAPIFVANFSDRPPTPIPFSEAIRNSTLDKNSNYCIYQDTPMSNGRKVGKDFLKGLKETMKDRPIDTLCWTCPIPNEPCDHRDASGYCRYSRFDRPGRTWRPDIQGNSGRIRLTAPATLRTRSAFGTFLDRYRPITTSEGVTKAIRIAVHDFENQNSQNVKFEQDELPGISEILFVKKLEIFQFTIALAVGLPNISIRKRAVLLLSERSTDGADSLYALSRRLVTEGLIIRLKPEVKQRILENWLQRRSGLQNETLAATLYHTVSHAFLKPLPMISGLDASEFHESFSPADNEVAIYDNSPGGIGGMKTTCEEGSDGLILRADYSALLMNSLQCQLDCSWSCKACLHTGNCGWINRQIKREMLSDIINERLRTRYFIT